MGIKEENYRIRELAEIVKETVPGCRVQFAEGAGPDKRCYRVDCSKIRRVLPDFRPQWSARAGAEQLYRAYKEIGLTLEDLEGPRFMRIRHVKKLHEAGYLDASLRWAAAAEETVAPGGIAHA